MSIALPDATNVTDLLEMLVGKPSGLDPEGGELDVLAPPPGTYISYLVDGEGTRLGAILADLSAALHLGGSMIMLPESALKEEAAKGEATEAIVDAIGEIFNNVRGLVNRFEKNPHVKPGDPVLVSSLDPAEAALLATSTKSLSLSGETPYGPGHVLLLSF